MHPRSVVGRRARILALASVLGVAFLLAFAVRSQAMGGSPPSPGVAEPVMVLAGSYFCQVITQPVPAPYPGEGDPQTVRQISHSVGISGTGAVTAAPAVGVGPSFGGRRGPEPLPLPSGFGVGNVFSGGTIDDCVRFAQAVRLVVTRTGCVASNVTRVDTPGSLVYTAASTRFSFVCEGPVSDEVHAVGEINRAVVVLEPQPGS